MTASCVFQVQHKVVLNDRKERKLTRQLSQPGEEKRRRGGGEGEEERSSDEISLSLSLFAESENGKEEEEGVRFTPRLRVFADVAGYSGVRGCLGHNNNTIAHDDVGSVPRCLCVGRTPTGCS